MNREERVVTRQQAVKMLQRLGASREEARAVVYGEGRKTAHETRRAATSRMVGANAAKRRRRRRAQVASSIAVAEASY